MKLSGRTVEIIIIGALLLAAIYLYTLPFQRNQMPFGDVDSSTHFSLADYMGQTGQPIVKLPYYLSNTYYMGANGGLLWYFPQYHTGAALLQILTGERIVGPYLFFALMSCLFIITSFVLVRDLFGTWAAAISSLWLLFSMRDIMWYILGVYPQVAGFALVPLFLLCIYRYTKAREGKKGAPHYLLLAGIVLIMQLFTHPQAIIISVIAGGIFGAILLAKNRRLPFGIKDAAITVAVMLVLVIPFFAFIPKGQTVGNVSFQPAQLSSLFSWYGTPESGMSPDYYSFSAIHHGWWLLPLAIIGVIFLLLRRKNEDLLMLSWLGAFYVCTHLSILGLGRSLRFMEVEAQILYPIAVVGVLRLPGLMKMKQAMRNWARLALAVALVLLILLTSAAPAYSMLKNAFPGPLRITPAQYDLAQFLRDKTPENSTVYLLGTFSLAKKKWIRMLSWRLTDFQSGEEWPSNLSQDILNHTYVVFDYSDAPLWQYYGRQAQLQQLQQTEKRSMSQQNLVYNSQNIRVYRT